ncbi:HlyD family efflux transporter periplasmic adaptor subunit [Chlorogloeopsis fritschii]|uniref:HlyD family efflux transporter periplasmic adaptor subunit n=1 Tax=Chlorogloeopsis fritschii TaxID=1124 RepID=UPI0023F43829|nr:HlyD family efflux transporter periplasmic adaptor subunit [Chlorogloeopsis fritschii]
MDRIIRSNAVETSSQSGSLEINMQDVHPCYNQVPEIVSICGGSVASIIRQQPQELPLAAAFPKLPTNTHSKIATPLRVTATSMGNCSISLQKMLEQTPSILPRIVLLGSLTFLATVIAWAFTGKIKQVSQVRGKFIQLGELYQFQPQGFDKVVKAKTELEPRFPNLPIDGVAPSLSIHSTNKIAQPKQSIAEITPSNTSPALVINLPYHNIDFVNKGDKVQIKLDADTYSQPSAKGKAEQQNAFEVQNRNILSGRIVSISGDAQPDQKLGWVYRVEVALASHQSIKLKAGQSATAQIIYQRRISDLFLKPIKEQQKHRE